MLGLLPSADLIDRALFPAPKVSYLVAAERVLGAVFGVPGVFGSGFAAVFGRVRQQTSVCLAFG